MLKIFNSLTKKLEEFKPRDPHNVKIYICGPTVYDHSHIGHARTYVSFDVIRNILEKYYNYNVTFVMNITDIDDKIINKSKEDGVSISEITTKYTKLFLDDMSLLNVRRPTVLTKVTEYIEKIKEYVQVLVDNKYAYESNGSIYFDVNEYKKNFQYPIFRDESANNSVDEKNLVDKKSHMDFALWKKGSGTDLNDEGRPGWHIECSVMSNDVLGDFIDIHAGGVDLKFPHHENEIAQCQARHQKEPWVAYFMHTGHLNINGLKMSKSLKNFTTIKSILERCTPIQLRILFLHHQWNKDMNYEESQLKFAENVEKKLYNFLMYVESSTDTTSKYTEIDNEVLSFISKTNKIVDESFSNNFDTPSGLINIYTLYQVRDFLRRIMDILGISKKEKTRDDDSKKLAELINNFRNDVRKAAKNNENKKKLFEICDDVRDKLKDIGYIIEDCNLESMIKKL
ncbi:cysteinyl-tRNA synthetase [Vairimorpha necatrix]|uniref:cysteine--tRNA ligase n=1 Tax=Vairimorpha necatrix TaxID=6039 RepID=A0AAX4JAL6_9MICR